ncbi:MAG: TetR/AcrR family transcriptional regulator [Actinomycetota bacterium]
MTAETTKHRAIELATVAFAERGVSGTSLDDLARGLGVTKQTILYHFGSKAGLVDAVFRSGAVELRSVLEQALVQATLDSPAGAGWERIEAVVRAAFALAVDRPELLGLLPELSRLGPAHTGPVLDVLGPLVDAAVAELEVGMDAGRYQRADSRLVLVSVYGAVTGVVTETEVLRAVGLDLDLRVAARLRRSVLAFLRSTLVPVG